MPATKAEPARALTIEDFLERSAGQDLLRFTTAGSVDDGKSTLIGRLLYDAGAMLDDQLASIRNSPVNRSTGPIDFSLLTDGLRAEREQGITIDVAYRHFATPRRKFIIADTPGHEQYTRNMATGASTADLAVVLIDARNGVVEQSRRHAYIAALLGIPRIAVAVNKMDLVGWSRGRFEQIRAEFSECLARIGAPEAAFIPVSALEGDNVADRSGRMPWYQGPSLLEYLEDVPAAPARRGALRLPVQYVIRPNHEFRGFAGQLASGAVRKGDPVMTLPSGRSSRVKSIVTYGAELESAHAPMSVTVCLEDEIDISRGDMLAHPGELPHVSRRFEAMAVWMADEPLGPGAAYLLKHTTQTVRATVTGILHQIDVNTLQPVSASELRLNGIGVISVETSRPLFFDSYGLNRVTGGFILIHPETNGTVCAGMIRERREEPRREREAKTALLSAEYGTGRVTGAERIARLGHSPATVWLTARPEAAELLERTLFERGCLVQLLDGRTESGILPELADVLHAAGAIVICSVPSDLAERRERAARNAGAAFLEFDPERMPASDEAAAARIVRALELKGILRRSERFSAGEGI